MAVKLLLRHIDRTGIAILMLAPVVALLVGSNMVASGYAQQAAASVALVQPSNAYLAYQPGSATPSSGSLNYDAFVRIEESNVSYAVPLLTFPSVVAADGMSADTSVLATNLTAFADARQSFVYGGVAKSGDQADAGAILAKLLDLRVGDNVTVAAFSGVRTLSIVGIFNSTDQSDTDLIVPLASSWALWPQTADKISYVEFSTADPSVVSGLSGSMTVIREEGIDQLARSFDSQTSALLDNWTYVLFALSVAAAMAAASRVVTEVSREYNTVRALGARLSTARALVFYELLIISGAAVLIGASAGLVGTSILGTLFKAIDGLPLGPSISPVELVTIGTASFLIILGAGSVALAWLPRKITETGEAP